jgi:hypothetical protein
VAVHQTARLLFVDEVPHGAAVAAGDDPGLQEHVNRRRNRHLRVVHHLYFLFQRRLLPRNVQNSEIRVRL